MFTRLLLVLALSFAAVAPGAARQRCTVIAGGALACPRFISPYADPARRPGFRAEQQNPYHYGTPSRPHNQPSY